MKFSIIIPVLNEDAVIQSALSPLQKMRNFGHEIIVVDGGSVDCTVEQAHPLADHVLIAEKGRSLQMNAGAECASHEVLVFLHIDTEFNESHLDELQKLLKYTGKSWGRFNVRLSGVHWMFRIIEKLINWRSQFSGVATGDQVLFVRGNLFQTLGGFAEIPLMEDIEISKRLKLHESPLCIKRSVTTSSRRWEKNGIFRTIFLMWRLRLAYFLGVSPDVLVKRYYG